MQDVRLQEPQQPRQAEENKVIEEEDQEFWEMHDDFEQVDVENQQGGGEVDQQDAAAPDKNRRNNACKDVVEQNTDNPNAGPSGYGRIPINQPLR